MSRDIPPTENQMLRSLAARVGGGDWADALNLWLATRRAPATRRAYLRALDDLLAACLRRPEEITRTDVLRWVQQMDAAGSSAATIAQRVAGVSSFFRFVMEEFYVNDKPLHRVNPAAGKSLRPKVELYGKSTWLSPDEAQALLRVIQRGTLAGQRDYALFLGYILLARRNSEWRMARWADFEARGEAVTLRWSGKGKADQRLDVPAPLWAAVTDYLRAAGQLDSMESGDYIFTALARRGRALPSGALLDENAPISSHEVGRLLKRYLRLAGLDGKRITPHSLRHTGAMLRRAAGVSDQGIMEYLGHSNLAITQVYLHTLAGNKDSHWMRVSELLGLSLD